MSPKALLLNILGVLPLIQGSPVRPGHSKPSHCTEILIRKEWRELESLEKQDYLRATKCLMGKPKEATPDWLAPAAVSRYDDFVTAHIFQTNSSHRVGHLLPWHRYYLAEYEKALRNECGYKGAQPYWDWTLDSNPNSTDADFFASPIFDPIDGFGGNGEWKDLPANLTAKEKAEVPLGRTGGGCVKDGPFKDVQISLGPRWRVDGNPRCLVRDLSPWYSRRWGGMNQTKITLDQPDFGSMTYSAELSRAGIHSAGHLAIGGYYGEMRDPYVSPLDPLFYFHHANLDRVWRSWQKRDLAKRLVDISGPIYNGDWNNTQGGNITLDFQMTLGNVAGMITVRDTMDPTNLCYDYHTTYD